MLVIAAVAMTVAPQSPARAVTAAGLPTVVPAVQQWQAGNGSGFDWHDGGRIVVDSQAASTLSADAKTFATDLGFALSTPAPQVVAGSVSSAKPGDVFLSLGGNDGQHGDEGYRLTVAPIARISAGKNTGVWWGTRTAIQLLKQSRTLPAGVIQDWPKYPSRSALVDTAGDQFSIDWWKNEIRDLSYLKLNELNLSVNGDGLNADQIKSLDAFAHQYHVNLVGEYASPSHMLDSGNSLPDEYTLKDANGNLSAGALDITNADAVTWAKKQASDAMGLLDDPAFHGCGDEYPQPTQRIDDINDFPSLVDYAHNRWGDKATPEDAYRDFMNQKDEQARQQGRSMRMWNDDLFPSDVVPLNKDITVDVWLIPGDASMTPQQLADNGNQLINVNQDYLYFDEHDPNFPNTTPERVWEQFDHGNFNGDRRLDGGAGDPHLSGIMLAEWGMDHEAAGDLLGDLTPLNRALSQKAWGSAEPHPTWAEMRPTINAIGDAPGFTG